MKVIISGMPFAINDILMKISSAADGWPQARRDAFFAEWSALMDNGCEVAEVDINGLQVSAQPSDDLLRHARSYGVAT